MDALNGVTEKVGWDKAAMACRPLRQQLNEEVTGDALKWDERYEVWNGSHFSYRELYVESVPCLSLQPVPCSVTRVLENSFLECYRPHGAPVGK